MCSNIITSISDICYYYLEDVEYYEDLFKVIKNIRNYAKIDQEYEMTNFATMTMTYLSKYLRYDMIEETLQWVSELPFSRQISVYKAYIIMFMETWKNSEKTMRMH